MMQCVRPQPLLDASLPEDVEEGSGNDSPTYTIGAALDHIGRPEHSRHSLKAPQPSTHKPDAGR